MHDIAVIGGDGIGPEVTREAFKVLEAAAEVHGFRYRAVQMPYGAEHYLKTKETFPDSALRAAHDFDAIFLGAIGDPRVETGLLERAIISGLRFGLDLYVNLRPVRLYDARFCPLKDRGPEHLDFIVVRENTEDAYAGLGGILKKGSPNEVAVQEMIYTRAGVERVVRYAYDLCRARSKHKRLTLVDKANAIRCQDIWTRTFAEVGLEYDDVKQDHAYVDAACMWMVKNPEWFDVIVTTNLFGDIVTDLGAQLVGGMGIAASGNIHPGRVSMFEPIHGSAPKYAGKNTANPLAAICAAGMMLDHLGEKDASRAVEEAVRTLLTSGRVTTLSAGALPTSVLGDMVAAGIRGARRTVSPVRGAPRDGAARKAAKSAPAAKKSRRAAAAP
ncbi:MAG: 3-isopropylmalate dehydrogenase [Planctomycetes bacterium]|nr:3-isopropylmalate dehydrogenase [Planctomycetota bacterium]